MNFARSVGRAAEYVMSLGREVDFSPPPFFLEK